MTWFTHDDLGAMLDTVYPLSMRGCRQTEALLFAHPDWTDVYLKIGRVRDGRPGRLALTRRERRRQDNGVRAHVARA